MYQADFLLKACHKLIRIRIAKFRTFGEYFISTGLETLVETIFSKI